MVPKHRHNYSKIKEWITFPTLEKDIYRHWVFTVVRECECGKTYKDDATLSEAEEYFKNNTCSHCKSFNKHSSKSDCILELSNRVQSLESKLEKVCDALSGIRTSME